MHADAADSQPRGSNTPPPASQDGSQASSSQRAQSPRERKGGLSCAECRRSKLRCDRNVPCQACVRRGCAKLCPNGMMAATKGNKALQSHAQKLGEQVTSMSAKIKELESALAAAHLQIRTHPESSDDKPEGKDAMGARRRMYGVASGSLTIDREGLSRYFGDTSASEYFTGLMPMRDQAVNNACHQPDLPALNLPPEIITLFNAFPFGLRSRPFSVSIFSPFLPSRSKAKEISEFFFDRYGSIYNPVPYEDFVDDLLGGIYNGASGMASLGGIHPHRLALFFGIMAIGHQRSIDFATANGVNLNAERCYVLTCAALSLVPIVSEAMCATVQTLFLIMSYLGCGTQRGCEESWILIGIMARVASRIGLHRDGAQFNLNPGESKRRRHIFWELFRLDAWISFATGRPPAINLADTDTKFPEFEGDSSLMPYPHWKYRHAAACLWPTTKLATADVRSYEETMALDRKIRTFPVPAHLHATLQGTEVWSWSTSPSKAIQQYCIVSDKEFSLLFLHRNYLAVALRTDNPLAHQFGGSVLAGYRCATRMCFALRDLYKLHPRIVNSMWFFWYRILSSCIVLAAIPIMAPGCNLAQNALTNLKATIQLFAGAASTNANINGIDLLRRLERRADHNFMSYWADPNKFRSTPPAPEDLEDLRLLTGREVIDHPSTSRSPASSPNRLGSQVSHMRTQPPPRAGHAEHHDGLHAPMGNFDASAYGDFASGEADPSSYQQLFRDLASVTDDAFVYPEAEQGFPTYEQIMQGSMPYFTGRAQMFLPPEHGFHPSPSPGFGPAEPFDQGAFGGRMQTMDASMAGANPGYNVVHTNTFWDSFVTDLMGRGGSPGAGGGQYNVPYSM